MIYRALFVRTPPCFYVLAIMVFLVLGLIWGVGLLRAMNMAQLPLSDTELRAYAETLWANPQARTFDIDGLICSPTRLKFLTQIHATVNNQLVDFQTKLPYGYNDSAASSHTSVCFDPSLFTNEVSLVRVVMYEIYNPFDITVYEWALKGTTPALVPFQRDAPLAVNPLYNPMETWNDIQARRDQLWDHPAPDSPVFEDPWFVERSMANPDMLCVRTHVDHYPEVEIRIDGYQIEDIVRDHAGDTGETLCAALYYGRGIGRSLVRVTVQTSPTAFLTHQWAVKIGKTREDQRCFSVSNSYPNCF